MALAGALRPDFLRPDLSGPFTSRPALSEVLDALKPGGRLFFHVMGALAEFESALISEWIKAGMASAKAHGVKVGRPCKLSENQIEQAL